MADGQANPCSRLAPARSQATKRRGRCGPARHSGVPFRGRALFILPRRVLFPEPLRRAETWHPGVFTQGPRAKRLHPFPAGCGFAFPPAFSLMPACLFCPHGEELRETSLKHKQEKQHVTAERHHPGFRI